MENKNSICSLKSQCFPKQKPGPDTAPYMSTLLCRLQRKMKIYLSAIQFSQNSFLNKTAPCKSILPWQNEGPLHINPDFLQPQGN